MSSITMLGEQFKSLKYQGHRGAIQVETNNIEGTITVSFLKVKKSSYSNTQGTEILTSQLFEQRMKTFMDNRKQGGQSIVDMPQKYFGGYTFYINDLINAGFSQDDIDEFVHYLGNGKFTDEMSEERKSPESDFALFSDDEEDEEDEEDDFLGNQFAL